MNETEKFLRYIGDLTEFIDANTDAEGLAIGFAKVDVYRAYENRAYWHYKLGEIEKAIADYTSAIANCSDHFVAYNARGEIYLQLGEYEKAVKDFTSAIETDDYGEATPIYFYNRACTYHAWGKYDESVSDFFEVIEATNPPLEPEDFKTAIHLLSVIIEVMPECEGVYDCRGEYYKALGKTDKANADFKKAEELSKMMI